MSCSYALLAFLLVPLVYWGMSTCSTNLSNLSRYQLARIGLTLDPCGVPLYVWFHCHSSKYPARSSPLMRRMNRSSLLRSRRMESNRSCDSASKHLEMFPARNQAVPAQG